MLRRNLDIHIGLVNGATGTVIDFLKHELDGVLYVNKIIIKFDNINIEQGIVRFTADYEYQRNIYVARRQFPISLAWAITIHKSQGLSLNSVMLDLGTNIFEPGMAYVALSRAKILNNVALIDFTPASLYCSHEAVLEYKRLHSIIDVSFNVPEWNMLPIGIQGGHHRKSNENKKRINHTESKMDQIKSLKEKPPIQIHSENNMQIILNLNNYGQRNTFNPNFIQYPLKIFNNDNSCYANVIIQVILHFGEFFQKFINLDATDSNGNSNNFDSIYKYYYVAMKKTSPNTTSHLIRRFTAKYPVNDNSYYLDGSQQDAFLFFLDLHRRLPQQLKNLFLFAHNINTKMFKL
jgi:hypothetical protein